MTVDELYSLGARMPELAKRYSMLRATAETAGTVHLLTEDLTWAIPLLAARPHRLVVHTHRRRDRPGARRIVDAAEGTIVEWATPTPGEIRGADLTVLIDGGVVPPGGVPDGVLLNLGGNAPPPPRTSLMPADYRPHHVPCVHRTDDPTGERECKACQNGATRLPVYGCALFGECVLSGVVFRENAGDGYCVSCSACDKREAPA